MLLVGALRTQPALGRKPLRQGDGRCADPLGLLLCRRATPASRGSATTRGGRLLLLSESQGTAESAILLGAKCRLLLQLQRLSLLELRRAAPAPSSLSRLDDPAAREAVGGGAGLRKQGLLRAPSPWRLLLLQQRRDKGVSVGGGVVVAGESGVGVETHSVAVGQQQRLWDLGWKGSVDLRSQRDTHKYQKGENQKRQERRATVRRHGVDRFTHKPRRSPAAKGRGCTCK